MNATKQSKHFSSLTKGDNFMLGDRHLVFMRYTRGRRLICMTHDPDMLYRVSLTHMSFSDNPVVEVWT